ncbi:MAG: chlorophyll synthesis pathway protein BchC [Pseudomonadota bacterium]
MDAKAVTFVEPERIELRSLSLCKPGPEDIAVDVAWSGISAGTERLLWSGRMPQFPGMGYPLVPGYESVGRVTAAGADSGVAEGSMVFVPGATCFPDARCLFGGTASRLITRADRVALVPDAIGSDATLLALAATAARALARADHDPSTPLLIIGHGALGRLTARLAIHAGCSDVTVWERSELRSDGARGYAVAQEAEDTRTDYRTAIDVSGDVAVIDTMIRRMARGGRLVLAGFYSERVAFAFPPAFMKEVEVRISSEWQRTDLNAATSAIAADPELVSGLVSHRYDAEDAEAAYATAFSDPSCLKMIIEWERLS